MPNILFIIFNKWERIVIAVLVILWLVLSATIYFKEKEITKLTQEYQMLKSECELKSKEYESNLKNYNDTIKIVEDKKEVEIKYINNYKGDPNATDCENANNLLSNYKF